MPEDVTQTNLALSMDSGSYGVANKSLSTTSCAVQEKDSADVVVNRVHDSIIDSSLGVVEFGDILGDPGSKLFPVVVQLLMYSHPPTNDTPKM